MPSPKECLPSLALPNKDKALLAAYVLHQESQNETI
jgi:hypothetical protein